MSDMFSQAVDTKKPSNHWGWGNSSVFYICRLCNN